ncbi:Putative Rho GTPase-activating protein FLJ46335 [Pteropus alecto]|uniref:Putative Rho GTPase-activating protein FLJ46335 n=1 Tax=Pteropus alecto TaxID=9402 RepID=L5KKS6_PTEAL|nr:Putative Rho GTPase-activating protein FLJ46335 [Pteropus alecto]
MPPLLLLSAFIFLVLGGAQRHNPEGKTKMISIHSLFELERLKLQETAYQELEARHFLSEFRPDRAISLKMFGLRLEEVLVNEFTLRAVYVDSLADLKNGALLLQTLQLSRISFPIGQRLLGSKKKMSLNPIAKRVPQVVEACCNFIEKRALKPQDHLSALQFLVYLMPPCHSDALECLRKALHKIAENCEDSIGLDEQLVSGNRMTSTNLALVFGSALLKKGKFTKKESRETRLGIDHYIASVNVV